MQPSSLDQANLSHPLQPTQRLLTAALTGLLSIGLSACGEDKPSEGEDQEHEHDNEGMPDASTLQDAGSDAAAEAEDDAGDAPTGPVVIGDPIIGPQSYATLKARCDEKGGYVQLHASCSGSNTCKGFSYGDWGEESELVEHTCASANGCVGLSCVYLPTDNGKDGATVYAEDRAPGGPTSCTTCHAINTANGHGGYDVDVTKFKVWVMPGSTTRTVDNWLDGVTAEQQEGIVAFGLVNTYPDGTPVVSMKGYHQLLSRGEVQRVVAHLRTLTPVIEEITKPQ